MDPIVTWLREHREEHLNWAVDFCRIPSVSTLAEHKPDVAVVAGPITNPANHNRYYLLAPASWLAAQGQAACLGGHLATINDGAENAWAYDTFSTYGNVEHCLWIGLTNSVPGSRWGWAWTGGEPLTFTQWGAFEPTGAGPYAYIIAPSDPQASFWRDDDAAGERCSAGLPNGLVEVSDCGNGRIDPGEECDDGNQVNGDGCQVTCRLPRCGDGIVDVGEECDDGNASPFDGCTNACTVCDNSVVTAPEECDDANTDNHDDCLNAPGYVCRKARDRKSVV
jgi:cysteine-rich repeat protein